MVTTGPILYCGDPHGRFQHILDAAAQLRPSAIVIVGDMQPSRALHDELEPVLGFTWFIHGNHDTQSEEMFERVWDSKLASRNVDGRVVELPDGTRLAGLGGVFRGAVWRPAGLDASKWPSPAHRSRKELAAATPPEERWRNGPTCRHWSSIFPDDFDRMTGLRADVLITHEAPGYHPFGFSMLDYLAKRLRVRTTVHGHHHDRRDSSDVWAAQGFASHGVGLRGITAIDSEGHAHVVLAGELDDTDGGQRKTPEEFAAAQAASEARDRESLQATA